MLDVRRLQVLREVARHRSLSAAAAALSYTPSAVSQQIAALVRHADEILGRMAAAQEELQALAGLKAGRLRLGAFSTAGAVLVPRAVKAFRDLHPGVEVSLVELDPEEAIPQLRARELDLALVYEFPVVEDLPLDGLDYVHLLDDRLYVALPEGHRLARRRRLKL